MVILGTQYAGEMKKGIFTIMHYFMPKRGILSLHSGCNIGQEGDVSLFFGLSGAPGLWWWQKAAVPLQLRWISCQEMTSEVGKDRTNAAGDVACREAGMWECSSQELQVLCKRLGVARVEAAPASNTVVLTNPDRSDITAALGLT